LKKRFNLLEEKKGTTVTVEVFKKGKDKPQEIKIVRDTIVVPTLEVETKGDVFVIRLYTFGNSASVEFRDALRQFVTSKKHKLILDLRGNPGGYLDAAVDISSWFLPPGKVVVSEDFGINKTPKVFRK
jgi:carboxyl-terminal processing protease